MSKSYNIESARGVFREFIGLVQGASSVARKVRVDVRTQIEECARAARFYEEATGEKLADKDVLEIGAGQMLAMARVFGLNNRVTATDLDVYAEGWRPGPYLSMLRRNGAKRVVKTIGRKVMGVDRRHLAVMKEELGGRLPRPVFISMDAAKMEFPDESFDFIYSINVFEHLPDPRAVLRECKRVLRPGGCVFSHVHLYTCDSGCHDIRIIRSDHEGIPYWPHLRTSHSYVVENTAYLNKLSLKQWREVFGALGDYREAHVRDEHLRPEMERVRASGELSDYSEDDLLVSVLLTLWRKPPA
jgi:SAM-dependent methyltransferase